MADLISPTEALAIRPGVPRKFYQVLSGPAPLAGCELPYDFQEWDRLHQYGFRHVVCLCSDAPRYNPSPLSQLVSCELTEFAERDLPPDHEGATRQILAIARAVYQKLENGEGVLVHCAAGRGRTGSVLGVVLRMFGYSPGKVIRYLNQIHKRRSGSGWPESPWQSSLIETCHRREDFVRAS